MVDELAFRQGRGLGDQMWTGRSGLAHRLLPLHLGRFMLDAGLTVLARGSNVLWVGSMTEVVEDAGSRARFRLALASADRAFALDRAVDASERGWLIFDLEGATPTMVLSAA